MFHSGINRMHILRAMPADKALGLCFGDANARLCEEARARGVPLMLDNGAFRANTPMTVERAGRVLDWYETFRSSGRLVYAVAPDVVGDGLATRQLQCVLGSRLRSLAEWCNVIVPVQGRDLDGAVLGFNDARNAVGPDIVAGIPSRKAAWSADMVRAFQAATKCRRFHFLGGSSMQRRDLSTELGIEGTSDSSRAVWTARCLPGGMTPNLGAVATKIERRVAGKGAFFHVVEGQRRWEWAWRETA